MADGRILSSLRLLLLLNIATSNGLIFEYVSKNNTVGGSLQIRCHVNDTSNVEMWIIKRGLDELVKTDPNVKFLDPSVSHWKHKEEKNGGMYSLLIDINPLTCSDNGTFTCLAKQNGITYQSDPLDIRVKAPPGNVEIRSNFILLPKEEIESTVGKQIHLICASNIGSPPGQARWLITNDISKPDTFSVITANVSGSEPKLIEDSCQSKQKISLKYYPNREMKLAIKCSVNNSVGDVSLTRIYNIIKKEKDSSKLIIIVVLCVIIPEIIIAIILGIVLYIRRNRAKKKKREMEAAEAEERALAEQGYSNNIPLKPLTKQSSVGGRRNRGQKESDVEKQSMTAYEDGPEA